VGQSERRIAHKTDLIQLMVMIEDERDNAESCRQWQGVMKHLQSKIVW
jgi:hypothetical protein